jgi:hypothetical protein
MAAFSASRQALAESVRRSTAIAAIAHKAVGRLENVDALLPILEQATLAITRSPFGSACLAKVRPSAVMGQLFTRWVGCYASESEA